jgi:hypothetical protein
MLYTTLESIKYYNEMKKEQELLLNKNLIETLVEENNNNEREIRKLKEEIEILESDVKFNWIGPLLSLVLFLYLTPDFISIEPYSITYFGVISAPFLLFVHLLPAGLKKYKKFLFRR